MSSPAHTTRRQSTEGGRGHPPEMMPRPRVGLAGLDPSHRLQASRAARLRAGQPSGGRDDVWWLPSAAAAAWFLRDLADSGATGLVDFSCVDTPQVASPGPYGGLVVRWGPCLGMLLSMMLPADLDLRPVKLGDEKTSTCALECGSRSTYRLVRQKRSDRQSAVAARPVWAARRLFGLRQATSGQWQPSGSVWRLAGPARTLDLEVAGLALKWHAGAGGVIHVELNPGQDSVAASLETRYGLSLRRSGLGAWRSSQDAPADGHGGPTGTRHPGSENSVAAETASRHRRIAAWVDALGQGDDVLLVISTTRELDESDWDFLHCLDSVCSGDIQIVVATYERSLT